MGNYWMAAFFSQILHMSMITGVIICMVFGIRLCLRRAPKIFSYLLWSVVLFRLLCPVTVESRFSVLGIWQASAVSENGLFANVSADGSEEDVQAPQSGYFGKQSNDHDEMFQSAGNLNSISAEKNGVRNSAGTDAFLQENLITELDTAEKEDKKASPVRILSIIWMLGIACVAGYGCLGTIRLKKSLADSVCIKDNIYVSDSIDTPFAMGILAPKIYLPGFLSEKEKRYIILHEQTHIRRGDLLVKLLAFTALAVHWFNPLVWAAFLAAEKDMEMSCDEMVMKQMKEDIRAEYSTSLLCLTTGKNLIGGTPLAFGEGNTKSRIKNIMLYKKPAAVVTGIAAVLVLSCLVGFGTNPGEQQSIASADTENPASEENTENEYKCIYSVELNTETENIPFEIWIRSDSDKRIVIDGQEIPLDPEFAVKIKYEQVETTIYHDFNGDKNREIALIDTGGAAGGAFQTIQIFENTDGQWKEMALPSEIYDTLPEFVADKLKEPDINGKAADLAYHRTVSLSYENEKIRMNYKLFTDDLKSAIGTVHKEVVYSLEQKKFVLEDATGFTPALSGESAYNDYENTYSAELKTGDEKVLFEIWADSASGNKTIRIDGQEISIDSEIASGKYGGIVETETYDYTGDGTEEIVLVDCGGASGSYHSFLVFGNRDGVWEEVRIPSGLYADDDAKLWKAGTEDTDITIDDSVYPRYRTISFQDEIILIRYELAADTDEGPAMIGTVQKEVLYDSKERAFVWGDTSFVSYEDQETFTKGNQSETTDDGETPDR